MITVPHAKFLRKLGELNTEQIAEIEAILLIWLGLKDVDSDEE
jgi:mRNA interferase MazF